MKEGEDDRRTRTTLSSMNRHRFERRIQGWIRQYRLEMILKKEEYTRSTGKRVARKGKLHGEVTAGMHFLSIEFEERERERENT